MKHDGYHFPLINPVKKFNLEHFIDHIREEIKEFEEETDPGKKEKEAIDILHSAETFVRKFFNDDEKFERIKQKVITKNKNRGYYKN